jgi:hypothetical protein
LAWAIEMARGMHAEIVAVFGLDVPVDLSLGFAPISAAMYQPEWRATLKRMPAGRRHTPRTKKLGFVIGLSEMGLSRKAWPGP